jgi:hypothetical protein
MCVFGFFENCSRLKQIGPRSIFKHGFQVYFRFLHRLKSWVSDSLVCVFCVYKSLSSARVTIAEIGKVAAGYLGNELQSKRASKPREPRLQGIS